MGEVRKVRDPVHGFVSLNQKEAEVLGTRILQRLRGIRQLALASLVYPGAVHTRFDHSLGVCHIAHLMAEALRLSEDERRLVGLAALLHDVGHGPFSHVSEAALELFAGAGRLHDRGTGLRQVHELIATEIIRADPELCRLMGPTECDKVAKLLLGGYGEPVCRAVVSGPLDADKQDYLLRDSHFCGVKYGVFDVEQLQRELCTLEDPESGGKQLAISSDGIHALEQFVLAKYYLTTQVYRHKVRLITDQMLIRAIRLGIEVDEIQELHDLYTYDRSPDFLANYTRWDDARFLLTFGDDKLRGTQCHGVLRRLVERRLLKQVYRARLDELPAESRDGLSRISEPSRKGPRDAAERAVLERMKTIAAEALEPDQPQLVIVHAYTIKSVREASAGDEGPILVQQRSGPPTTFHDESALFRSITEGMSEEFIEVYAPVRYGTDHEMRGLLKKLFEPISEALTTLYQPEGAKDGNT